MRKEILQKVGLKFTAISSDVDEQTTANTNEEYLINLSKLKANKIASSLSEGVVIGADSMICFNGRRIGKPKTKEEASRILKELSGKVNYALTGVTILDLYTGKSVLPALLRIFLNVLSINCELTRYGLLSKSTSSNISSIPK